MLLAQAFMREGRPTGNHQYYGATAMSLLNAALREERNDFEALCCKATLYLTEHHAAERLLALAQQARHVELGSAYVHGLLADAQLKLGQCAQAATATARDDLGHHTDQELALVFLRLHALDKALLFAQREYERHPHSLGVSELLA